MNVVTRMCLPPGAPRRAARNRARRPAHNLHHKSSGRCRRQVQSRGNCGRWRACCAHVEGYSTRMHPLISSEGRLRATTTKNYRSAVSNSGVVLGLQSASYSRALLRCEGPPRVGVKQTRTRGV